MIGTILAEYTLLNPGGNDARFEAVLAFQLEPNLHAVVRLDLLEPDSDNYIVKQLVSASAWNRGQASSRSRVSGFAGTSRRRS